MKKIYNKEKNVKKIITVFVFLFSAILVFANTEVEKLFKEYWQSVKPKVKIKLCKKIIKISPESKFGYYCKSYISSGKKHFDKSLRYINRAIKIDKNFIEAYIARGFVYSKLGYFNLALKDTALGIPKFWQAYFIRATVYHRQKKYSKALEDLNKVLITRKDFWVVYAVKADILIKFKKYQSALKTVNKAIKLSGKIKLLFKMKAYIKRKLEIR